MVVISAPSACPANIEQAGRAVGVNSTVHHTQTPCSQPTWVPVRPQSSRITSLRVRLASTVSRIQLAVDHETDVDHVAAR